MQVITLEVPEWASQAEAGRRESTLVARGALLVAAVAGILGAPVFVVAALVVLTAAVRLMTGVRELDATLATYLAGGGADVIALPRRSVDLDDTPAAA